MFDITEQQIICPRKQRVIMYGSCIERCPVFPCSAISERVMEEFKASPFTDVIVSGFTARRNTMYIGMSRSKGLVTLPPDFSPDTGAAYVLENDIVEVYQISKTFVPQVKLVMKPQHDRTAIREQSRKEEPAEQPKPTKKGKKK